jgi:predicted nucleotidyltransferase component of viral defense system
MASFLDLDAAERRELCEEAQAELGLAASSIEKDWWVSFTLRELFALPDIGASLTFKGGTSLSKGWQLVQRFSEDIDVVVDRAALGFGDGTFNRKRLDKLRAACSGFVVKRLREALHARLTAVLCGGAEAD